MWERFYAQDPWGEERQDLRELANELRRRGAEDIGWFAPYMKTDEELAEECRAQKEAMAAKVAELDREAVDAKLEAAKQKHYENKKTRG